MSLFPVFSRDDFPFSVDSAESESALDALRTISDPDTDMKLYMVSRPDIVMNAGRLLTAAVRPYMNATDGSQLANFEDESPVPDSRMHRVVDGEHVMVRPIARNGCTQLMVMRDESVRGNFRINAALPFNEHGLKYGTAGSFFIVNHDLEGEIYVRPDDQRFPQQLQVAFSPVVAAIDRGTAVLPDYS